MRRRRGRWDWFFSGGAGPATSLQWGSGNGFQWGAGNYLTWG